MKKRLCTHKKRSRSFRVIFYSSEMSINLVCVSNPGCKFDPQDNTNYRCNPPESTREDARNVRCNLAANC
jgi:hypothetical protein